MEIWLLLLVFKYLNSNEILSLNCRVILFHWFEQMSYTRKNFDISDYYEPFLTDVWQYISGWFKALKNIGLNNVTFHLQKVTPKRNLEQTSENKTLEIILMLLFEPTFRSHRSVFFWYPSICHLFLSILDITVISRRHFILVHQFR